MEKSPTHYTQSKHIAYQACLSHQIMREGLTQWVYDPFYKPSGN